LNVTIATLSELQLSREQEYRFIEEICDWERIAYGDGLHRQPSAFHACVEKNRSGFIVAVSDNKLLGYADVWQLELGFYSRLRVGLIDEESLAASVILSSSDAPSGLWYVGSMICEAEFRKTGGLAAALLFAKLCSYLPIFFARQPKYPASVLGVGSSSFGEKLLCRWAFTPVLAANNAIDIRPRYEKTLRSASDASCFIIRSKYHEQA
jgi:hypothetical protein